MATLKVENLTKKFSSVVAVDNVSFEVGEGDFLSLIGPSGCGKTTTLRCIAGLEKLDGGRVLLGDKKLTSMEEGIFIPPYKRNFGMVFQSYAVWPHMTTFDNVSYPLKMEKIYNKKEIEEKTNLVIKMVKLDGLQKRYPAQLSGGQQQRVSLARALVMEPEVLLYDEPLSNLDAKLREQMRYDILELHSRLKIPALYVTHDQAEAMVLSKRIVVMHHGKFMQVGAPQDIYNRPTNRFVSDFIGLTNFIKGTLKEVYDNKEALVETTMGKFRCSISKLLDTKADREVLISVRPEKIQTSKNEFSETVNTFKGRVKNSVFVGPYYDIFFESGDENLRIQENEFIDIEKSREVYIKASPSDCMLIEV